MSDTKPLSTLREGIVSPEVLEKISGGECTYDDYNRALLEAQQTYESLIDLTSYVIERVANSLK